MPKYVLSLGVYWTSLYMLYSLKKKKGGEGVKYETIFIFNIKRGACTHAKQGILYATHHRDMWTKFSQVNVV